MAHALMEKSRRSSDLPTRLLPLGARVTEQELRRLATLSRSHDRPLSREVRRAIRFYLAHQDLADAYLSGDPNRRTGDD